MVLIFGGTTEGKRVAQLLDVIEQDYVYSTKTDAHREVKGQRIVGALDQKAIEHYCQKHGIKLIVDAAHPFAVDLHQNIYEAAQALVIEVIRYERVFPDYSALPGVRYFDDYESLQSAVLSSDFQRILALTGVQTIARMPLLWQQKECYFRILETPLSREKALATGLSEDYVIAMHPEADEAELRQMAEQLGVELLLSKESGESGLVETKIKAAEQLNLPLWMVKRPALPDYKCVVDNDKAFLKAFYPLRKWHMKDATQLRSGFTTGTCVTAAAKACMMALQEGQFPADVEVQIPTGEHTRYSVFPEHMEDGACACVVIKDAGDDPDATHGQEIGCHLRQTQDQGLTFKGGKGIGVVTLAGLQVPVGEPAINPVPRQMICDVLHRMAEHYEVECQFEVSPFVPEGERLASHTFNPRIGVKGGISILGTTGKVKPYSNEAFLASIREQIRVAKGNDCRQVVLTSGKRSELVLKPYYPHLPDAAFIHFGNLVGDTLTMVQEEGLAEASVALMFGKAIKLAEGHLDTHSQKVSFNPEFAISVAQSCGYDAKLYAKFAQLSLANAILEHIPFSPGEAFYQSIAERCKLQLEEAVNDQLKVHFYLLIDADHWIFVE